MHITTKNYLEIRGLKYMHHLLDIQEQMRFVLACDAIAFELPQEPMRFVLACQANMFDYLSYCLLV